MKNTVQGLGCKIDTYGLGLGAQGSRLIHEGVGFGDVWIVLSRNTAPDVRSGVRLGSLGLRARPPYQGTEGTSP